MKTSLIMCTYNRAEQLRYGLRTILDQTIIPDEIIIVDDGSIDGTRDVVTALQITGKLTEIDVNYIYLSDHPSPRISCYPRNVGIKQATGDVLIFTEPEALHVGDTIDQLLSKLEEYPYNTVLASQVWTMGQRIQEKFTDEDFKRPSRIISHQYAMLTDNEHPHNTKAPNSDFAITGESNCNAGILFAGKRQWFIDVGGFNEEFEGHGFDDFDLFNRLAAYGHGVKKFPDIAVIHQWHEKNYPYNIYDAAEKNGKISEAMILSGEYEANKGKDWGKI